MHARETPCWNSHLIDEIQLLNFQTQPLQHINRACFVFSNMISNNHTSDGGDSIRVLHAQYLQLVLANKMSWADMLDTSELTQQKLYEALFAPGAHKYAPPITHTTSVLKRLIAYLEDLCCEEINEHIVELYTSLLSAPKLSEIEAAQMPAYVTYPFPSSDGDKPGITLVEKRSVLTSNGHTGSRTWEAAFALGEYLLQHTSLVHKKSILELGAGTGFNSILAARLGASDVLATDGDCEVIEGMQQNVVLNEDTDIVSLQNLVWNSEHVAMLPGNWDLIIGADVTYDSRVFPDLVATLSTVLRKSKDAVAVIAVTVRSEETVMCFEDTCSKRP